MSDLISELKNVPYQFGLFQAASLIERMASAQNGFSSHDPKRHPVQFRSHLSLGFPAADIHAIKQTDADTYQIYSSLFCLAGSNGPLPLMFTEMVLSSLRQKDPAPAEFLDIFNHRLLHLLYSVKQKYEPALGHRPLNVIPTLRFVDACASLGRTSHDPSSQEAVWLKHAALVGSSPRSMATLLAMLKERVGISFQAHQFMGDWLNLPVNEQASLGNPNKLTSATKLGINATLGRKAWHQGGAIMLKATGVMPNDFFNLLPSSPLHQKLYWLIQRHQSSHQRVCLEISIEHQHLLPNGLGHCQGPRLGLSSWLSKNVRINSAQAGAPRRMDASRFWLSGETSHSTAPAV
ncbi:MAG: type VI secretion system baseplate subunit TssG [Betaproteobacteria bacterium]|nr:type VI secretion system baseplate subunit TssG [Betaproteobacteria bacterium]NBY05663.1 type VI secretion system baseplate subunit TssG [Betaproteobacteria bacterium]